MNELQVWTLIGVFAALMFTYTRSVTHGVRDTLVAKIDGLQAEMNARFETFDVKLAHLDRDVQAISRRVFGEGDLS